MKKLIILAAALLLLVPALASAETADPTLHVNVYTLLIGSLVPLATYVLNFHAPWAGEKVKVVAHAAVTAVAASLFQLIDGGIGWNGETLDAIVSAVAATFVAHSVIWRPSGVSEALGGGQNSSGQISH